MNYSCAFHFHYSIIPYSIGLIMDSMNFCSDLVKPFYSHNQSNCVAIVQKHHFSSYQHNVALTNDLRSDARTSKDTDSALSLIMEFAFCQIVSLRALSKNSCPVQVRRIIFESTGLPSEPLAMTPSTKPASIRIAVCPAPTYNLHHRI